MSLYIKHKDGTIEDSEGNVIFFSLQRFISNICEGNDCFLCGADPESKEFNDEHVIPKWLLRKYDLFDSFITLPNGELLRYDKYTVPCCKECNSFLGSNIEEDIREIVEGGINSVNKFIQVHGPWKIFFWLSLIFLKTHLKDSYLRKHLDRRKGDETIASDYEWELMHHIHCIVRAIKTGVSIENECLGSFCVLPAEVAEHYESYDYRDVYSANTILLRIGDIAFFAVLDDSCAALHFFSKHFKRITAPLSPLQLREVLSHFTLLNYKLKYRPVYFTKVDPNSGEIIIGAELPESMELEEHTCEEFGKIMYACVSDMIEIIENPELSSNIENIKKGRYRFLFQ